MIIRGHDLEQHTVEQFEELKELYGVEGYQLAIKKSFGIKQAILDFDSINSIDDSVFKNTKILGAYFNPVHPNLEEVEIGISNFIFNMRLAEKYKIKYVGTETGSCLGSPWDYHPENHTTQTLENVTAVFKRLSIHTKGIDVSIAIEPAFHHVIKDVDTLLKFDKAIGDDRMVYILDLFNLLNAQPYKDYKEVLAEFLSKAGNKTKIVHLKDFIVENMYVKQVPIGNGIVDFDYVLSTINKCNNDILYVLEGTPESRYTDVQKMLRNI